MYSWGTSDKSKLGLFVLDSFTLVLTMMDAKNALDNFQMQHNVSNLLPSFCSLENYDSLNSQNNQDC